MPLLPPYQKFAYLYDALNTDEFYENYYNFLTKLWKKLKFKPKRILELACGTGRLAELLLKNHYEIEGLDLSSSMLRIARLRKIKCYLGDMTRFNLKKKYDVVLCFFDSLNYLPTEKALQQCFVSVQKCLTQGGLFIFDMNSDFKINQIVPNFGTEYHKVKNAEAVLLNSFKPNTWITKIIIFQKTKHGKYERFYEDHIEKAYKLAEIKKILRQSGLKIINIYSDFKLQRVKKNSKRWFFVCRR